MRLFTGLDIPAPDRQRLDDLIGRLRPLARLRWSPAANLHVTTKFIGEWPAERLGELEATLATVPRPGPIRIRLSGLGWFPNPHQPRIFWVAVKAPPALAALASGTEERLAALGIAAETRAYTPHLTLARISSPVDLTAVRREVAALPTAEFGDFEARAFHLYLSEPDPAAAGGGTSRYTPLASFPLEPEAAQ